jgi:hypothetical protein
MPDDPSKRGWQDRNRSSKQKHEQAYQRRKASGDRAKSTRGRQSSGRASGR